MDHTEELEELCQSAKQLHGNNYDADSSSDDEVWLYGENHKTAPDAAPTVNGNSGVGFRKKGSVKQNEDASSVTVHADINENISNREEVSEDSDIFLDFGDVQLSPAQRQQQQELKDKAAADLLL